MKVYEVEMTLKIPYKDRADIAEILGLNREDYENQETDKDVRERYLKNYAFDVIKTNIGFHRNVDTLFDKVKISEEAKNND